jgi:predicted amidohydrolase
MRKFKISQIQFQAKSTPIENATLLEKLFFKAQKYKPDLICTPECSNIITNDKKHLFAYSTFQNDCPIIKKSKIFAKENKVNINLGSLLLKIKGEKKLVNRSILINKQGKIQSTYDKIHLFDVNINADEIHRESNSFIKGNKLVISKINGINIGFSICYDLRFPNMYRSLAKKGVQIVLIPAAFTVPSGKAHWETLIRARSIENSFFVVATNMCGIHHSGRKTYGHSMLCNPWGDIKNKCFSKSKIINTSIDLDEILTARSKIPFIFND